jgi:hypothetical protein
MSKKRAVAITLIIILSVTTVGALSDMFVWGSGTIYISTHVLVPTNGPQAYFNDNYWATLDVLENGKIIGLSNTELTLTVGQHHLSFGNTWHNEDWSFFNQNSSSEYDPPNDITVEIRAFSQTQYISTKLVPKFGFVTINPSLEDQATGITTQGVSQIYIDNSPISQGSLNYKIFDFQTHTATFEPISGYNTPQPITFQAQRGMVTSLAPVYLKVLSESDQQIAWARQKADSYLSTLDPNSNVVSDRFLQWMLNNRVSIPFFYEDLHKDQLNIFIAQYTGTLLEDRTNAIEKIATGLKTCGYDITSNNDAAYSSVSFNNYHFSDSNEILVCIKLKIHLASEVLEESSSGTLYHFTADSLTKVNNLCPQFIPAGVSYNLGSVYVKVLDVTRPLDTVYTSFQKYANDAPGGYYNIYNRLSIKSVTNFYMSNELSQIVDVVNTGVMGTVLVDFPDFCRGMIW